MTFSLSIAMRRATLADGYVYVREQVFIISARYVAIAIPMMANNYRYIEER